jgi:four helix bundle protein
MNEQNAIRSYQDLKVWQLGIVLAENVYRLTAAFPKHELYGLGSQMQRAAVSVPSNVAEGSSRDSTREYLKHLSIAVGSLAELETQLIISHRLEYCSADQRDALVAHLKEIGRMLSGLQRSLRAKLDRPGE